MNSYENKRKAREEGLESFKDGDVMTMGYSRFMIGSVASYAIKHGDCPIESIEEAKENGHDMHYVFGLGASITASPQKKERCRSVEYGQRIIFEGRIFSLQKAPNHNIKLVRES